ncbi:phenylalanyl-tRNA synthetase [Synechocystis sp. PCC 6803]|uniref:Phenylalanine--tRNA ligase beta subunit n=1 Tax=Synechocystis sp. (strain ATCC 27184 / PCC 6803 / Kazusa) TaxID=1111708 RepID=SYFB_SYNY3|nr:MULTISPECIES: phenylalanine--tRNA ligase subunit beta [unclassified Synechocystis]P74296.1 RecName: Full=Phenylalanine--tRNA ligase beta subunit; AltName: Full=Phenylalanyl-tRNA synthetase beta subunit; Short=PheRS [Synechocystis sp. PCC 6803 substr. Kazusa]BAM54892.1 phenylalanyl-tRNA synthetase subunit beta [Synechocystis sp. PCC 6803] [Bacillus subtilis BEST7613]AGF52078.1 phenylalanyl-tRNA synthetase [Synechocystis sp. PCC 6803]ALJ68035.1 phenylalanyl-tRNA synthetase subunit beta [Synech
MRISVNWLQSLVELNLSPEELGELLTIAGLEVEEIEDRRSWAAGVVLGRVISREKHPNADKLSVCVVDIGTEEPSTIVCGAANVRADILVPVATLGSYLPKVDLKIKPAKLRGVKSSGMICSLAELGLSKESEGIHIFPDLDLPSGSPVGPLLGLDDVILEISPTANRADALSMVGVAREVAALTGGKLSLPEIKAVSVSDQDLPISVTEPQACPTYVGTVIRGVKVGPSPDWLQQRLLAAGTRPINNVVDVTNYVLLEWGQPLHSFDQDKLQTLVGPEGFALGVRFAEEGEKLITLDDQERTLQPQNLLVTANDQPVAIAGVMGGAATEVDENTQNIVLETALFDGVTIRKSSKAINLRSESSTRYERGVNRCELEVALHRAIALMTELAGGTVVRQGKADQRQDRGEAIINLRLERLQQLLGKVNTPTGIGNITAEDVERILTDLGCGLTRQSDSDTPVWAVTVPSYRQRDIEREIDLIEEVARLYGYDHFCEQLPSNTIAGGLSPSYQAELALREACRGVGLTEVVHYSLVKPHGSEVMLANPLFAEYSALRTNLLDGLITAFANNQAQNNGALNAFEVGRVFWQNEGDIGEADHLAGICGGSQITEGTWPQGGKPQPMSWYDAKGLLEAIFQRLGATVTYSGDHQDPRLHPGRTALLSCNGTVLGRFGQLHPQLRREKGLIDEVYAFEITLTPLYQAMETQILGTPDFRPYSPYPAVARDLALYAPLELTVAELTQAMVKAGGDLLEQVELFDEYRGQSVPAGQRSLAFSLAYRVGDRTLTDADVEPLHNQIREALTKQFAVSLRS